MPLDTSIPLQVQAPQIQDYSQLAAQTQANALRAQIAQQEMQQNALRMQYMQEDRARAEASRAAAARKAAEEKALRARILQESGGDAKKASTIALSMGRPDIAESYAKGRESIAKAGESEADLEKKAFTNSFSKASVYAPLVANGAVPGRAVVGALFDDPMVGGILSKVMTREEALDYADKNPQGLAQILATPPDKIYDAFDPAKLAQRSETITDAEGNTLLLDKATGAARRVTMGAPAGAPTVAGAPAAGAPVRAAPTTEAQIKQAAAREALPGAVESAELTLKQLEEMVGSKNLGTQGNVPEHPGFQGAVGATWKPLARFVPGTSESDFDARYNQIEGGAFLKAYESLKGTGQITEKEGEKATSAISRMKLSQSEKEFIDAAKEFYGVVRNATERAKSKLKGTSSATPLTGTTGNGISYTIETGGK